MNSMSSNYGANISDSPTSYIPPDVILTVHTMRPYNRPLEQWEVRLGRLMTLDTVYYVRGMNSLDDLRQRISCPSDYATSVDHSEEKTEVDIEQQLSKERFKSSFFYINGTFYNDTRGGCIDLSQTVREWAEKRSNIGPFQTTDMSELFGSLRLRLGQPYLFQHQGCCEHLIIFTDLRMMHPDDAQEIDPYPLQVTSKMKKRTACQACKIYTARWVVYNNDRLPFDPGFFCGTCFADFNYTEDGEKIGSYEAVPHFDRSAL